MHFHWMIHLYTSQSWVHALKYTGRLITRDYSPWSFIALLMIGLLAFGFYHDLQRKKET